jgi:hypothetical protein
MAKLGDLLVKKIVETNHFWWYVHWAID